MDPPAPASPNSQGGASLTIDPWRHGDLIVDREHTPIGTINSVIRPPSGARLIVRVAGYHDRYVVVASADLVGTIAPPIGTATRHVTLQLRVDILEGVTYRREMGRLIRDLSNVDPFQFPSQAARAAADDLSRTTVQDGLARSRLTAGQPIIVEAWHGSIHLSGRVATDVGVVEATRIAYAAVGVWYVVSTLVSDEALGMHLRRHVRGSETAAAVAAITVVHGVAIVTPFDGALLDPNALATWHAETPGLAAITVGPSRPR